MSETCIIGYKLKPDVFDEAFGANSETIIQRVLDNQSDLLESSEERFDDGESGDVEDALRALIAGEVDEDMLYECACMIEPVLEEVAEKLEDTTEFQSLWFNQDFWIDDFEAVFEELGLEILQSCWLRFSFPLHAKGETPDWPIVALLDDQTLAECLEEFEGLDIAAALEDMPDALLGTKGDDLSEEELRATLLDNINCLKSWISACQADGDYLVIIFDGDS